MMRTPALNVGGRGMCRLRTSPDALVLRVSDLGEREALLQGQAEVFFTTPHYDGYPYVLARMEAIDPVELGELLEEAWACSRPSASSRAGTPSATRRPAPRTVSSAGRGSRPA